jgi:hypothetical protein
MTKDLFYDKNWLLAYDANIKKWLPSVGGKDHIGADPNFSFLRQSGVYFYDQSLGTPAAVAPVPLPTLPTISLIVQTAAGY